MTRGLPVSLVIHILGVGLVLWLGNAVNRPVYEPPRRINVQVVHLPSVAPQAPPTETTPSPEPEVVPPKPKVEETKPPKEVPEPRPEEKKPEPKVEEDPRPEAKPETPPRPVEDSPPEEAPRDQPREAVPVAAGAAVSGTDSNFPFAWYLSMMEGQIARNWNPRQMGFKKDSGVYCTLHFTIMKNGTVTGLTVVRGSGIGVYDREARRAVQAVRLPQLPPDFGSSSLGVTMTFNLKTDN
ncbi:hypothetical protein CSA17_04815 [bacterium DOLJORAL78_65_58]|nr:MAG: hypothetical protein CSB20_08385 [bacterium DOLZORAL124_64_63]PIE75950.1 MAG: hypothetical protein CSA17_04815 [bacterium DOLJORAL78_65_58]